MKAERLTSVPGNSSALELDQNIQEVTQTLESFQVKNATTCCQGASSPLPAFWDPGHSSSL